MQVLDFLRQQGPAYHADLIGPCGTALEVEAEVVRLKAEGLISNDARRRWHLRKTTAPAAPPQARDGGYDKGEAQERMDKNKAALKTNGAHALQVRRQETLPRRAEPVEDEDDLDGLFKDLQGAIGAGIQAHIADLIGRPGDMKLLTDMLHKLALRKR